MHARDIRRCFSLAVTLALSCVAGGPLPAKGESDLADQAKTIVAGRCMVCHGCYDAPCQLKLEAHEGLRRGASEALVYDGARLKTAEMTRLFDDALSEAGWRDKGFFPVLDDRNHADGVMYRMLALKQSNPLPVSGPLPEGFDFSLNREQQCPTQADFDDYAGDYPLWGMPYGLPGLNEDEHRTLTRWIEAGAPAPRQAALSEREAEELAAWESFLNGGSPKQQLLSRYLYEHLFLASLYLDTTERSAWFRVVRSATPPGTPIQLIATRRPFDDPGHKAFYYRLQRMPVTPLEKIHMPYRFDGSRRDWLQALFLDAPYTVESLPGYAPEVAANPFKAFEAMPVALRYRFLLEEAQFTIMNFIKGPVCRGQIALSVIDDHFWIMFVDPDQSGEPENSDAFLARESDNLRLPTADSRVVSLFTWRRYARAQQSYQDARSAYIVEHLQTGDRLLNEQVIWDGDGRNPNAALTVFRHFDTATVLQGFVGEVPKTAWVIDYALLERIHYLLVAGFDVYGNVAHQLESRLYMDFLRMEGEYNFLLFMPPEQRKALRRHWYRDARAGIEKYFTDRAGLADRPSGIAFRSDDPKREFLLGQRYRIHGAKSSRYDYRDDLGAEASDQLQRLEAATGQHNSYLPEVSFVNVIGDDSDHVLTLIRNSGYSNIAQLFKEEERRLPAEDSLTVARGLVGAFPNQFFQVNQRELPRFTGAVLALESEEDYRALRERWGVARNAPWFWRISDKFHRLHHEADPLNAGLFDYNRYRGY
jgi:hypothetical protein